MPSDNKRRRRTARAQAAIEVVGARTHNLKNVSCSIPHGKVTVVTGLSGAGKSSLAFDTVYAEGQRRFVESISTYARQFLRQMERPPVEEIRNILPAVALEARNNVRNARSTVATLAEVADVLRLLFTHLGQVICPDDGATASADSVDEIVRSLVEGAAGERFLIVAQVPRPKKGATTALREMVRQGFRRTFQQGDVKKLTSSSRWLVKDDPMVFVLGRFSSGDGSGRLPEAVEDALVVGKGVLAAVDDETSNWRFYSRELACAVCARRFRRPEPALFSFNSPLGACSTCQGFGRVIGVDRDRVIPDSARSLLEGPIAPWNTESKEKHYVKLLGACEEHGIPQDIPWRELTDEQRNFIWSGDGDFLNLDTFFRRLERKSYRVHVRVLLARYRSYDSCPACEGSRLKPEAHTVRLQGTTIPEILRMGVEEARAWLAGVSWSPRQREVGGHLIDELEQRIGILDKVGLDYLTLDRQARTLSGGETQRIQLAAALGSGLTSTLYVLDEPTVGLHPRDSDRLVAILRTLAEGGNTVLVVEHDRTLIEGADYIIDLGPVAGEKGGEIVAAGTLDDILDSPTSVTGAYLKHRAVAAARRHVARFRREQQGVDGLDRHSKDWFEVVGASANNLRDLDVRFPAQSLVAVAGVSGSGKSTLVENVIYANTAGKKHSVDQDRGRCRSLAGFDTVEEVVLVDQRPLGRSSRSNPVTYVKAYDEIRRLFASTPTARRRGITPGHFSFNVDKGRCQSCLGTGEVEVDMQFMSPVTIKCDMCNGRRFRSEVLRVRFRGLDIAQTLELSVDRALEHFASHRKVCERLGLLVEAGLGYLRLGQPTSTLSGGEAQRLKLAAFLGAAFSSKKRLFLFDEPTTGLHFADIDLLSRTLRKLVEVGHSVVVVEHSSDFIARCDWVIDLGPGGGKHGGELLFSGPIEMFLEKSDSPTAVELRRHLNWQERSSKKVASA